MNTKFVKNDGGREAAGFSGKSKDCVTRAIAIATDLGYKTIYDALAEGNANQRKTRRASRHTGKHTAGLGINTNRKWFKDFMASLGWVWTPTMQIGSGCTVHLKAEELPKGRIIVSLSKHFCAVIDGVIHDTYDCSRNGTRCVYGYWSKANKVEPSPIVILPNAYYIVNHETHFALRYGVEGGSNNHICFLTDCSLEVAQTIVDGMNANEKR
jgi:hypothetical protein